jgi:hypothetical protein
MKDDIGTRRCDCRNATAVTQESIASPNSAIFEVLKTAHPEVAEADLKTAIVIAVDFERACIKSFKYSKDGLDHDARHAIETAKAAYPQFEEETYKLALFRLMTVMR